MSSSESQENEIASLQSIYEEKEFFVDGMDPPSGRIVVDVNLPDGFFVSTVELPLSDAAIKQEVFQVDHLPPIILFFKLPTSYPLETCPSFLLSCNWLSLEQLSLLCKRMEYLWEMNMDVILFSWIQFLRYEALDFLNISVGLDISELETFKIKNNFRHRGNDTPNDSEPSVLSAQVISIGPSVSGGNAAIDVRAFNDLTDGKLILQILRDYNEYKKENIFDATIHMCEVCFQEKLGHEFITFKECGHYFCKDCVKGFFAGLIADGNIYSLKCLVGECGSQLLHTAIKGVVGPDLFERYDTLLNNATIEAMPDVAYCPRLWCQCPCIIDIPYRMGTCPGCGLVFCPFCKMTFHGVNPCNFKTDKQMQLFEEYYNGNLSKKRAMEEEHGKRMMRSLVDETLSEKWKRENSKSCPHCRASIQKTEGCHKMTCFR